MSKARSLTTQLTMGTDPEGFFFDRSGTVVPSDRFLPPVSDPLIASRKAANLCAENDEKMVRDGWFPGAKLHYDGIQAEFTVAESTCRSYVIDNIFRSIKKLVEIADENEVEFKFTASAPVTEELIQSAVPDAQIFGCDPERSVWLDGMQTAILVDPLTHPLRYAGGHIHIGSFRSGDFRTWLGSPANKLASIRVMDVIAGTLSILIDRDDASSQRRDLYGNSGSFRYTPYGFEYRTLGNFWLNSPTLTSFVLALARECVELTYSGKHDEILGSISVPEVIQAINTNDFDMALYNWNKLKDTYFDSSHYLGRYPDLFAGLIKFGASEVFGTELKKTWRLELEDTQHGSGLVELGGYLNARGPSTYYTPPTPTWNISYEDLRKAV